MERGGLTVVPFSFLQSIAAGTKMTKTVVAWRRTNMTDLRANGQKGDYALYRNADNEITGMTFLCPCGCGNMSFLNFDTEAPGAVWMLTGDANKPTVRPSVHQTGMPCRWHGYLTTGVWVEV
jgi:hypothetical protein